MPSLHPALPEHSGWHKFRAEFLQVTSFSDFNGFLKKTRRSLALIFFNFEKDAF